MGFYPPNTLITQARTRGVMILPLDINESEYFAASTGETIRIGFRQVRGMPEELGQRIHEMAPFEDIRDFCRKCRPPMNTLESLVAAGAFDSLHPNRRALLWQAETAWKAGVADDGADRTRRLLDPWPSPPPLPDFNDIERLSMEYSVLSLNPGRHLVSLARNLTLLDF